MLRREALTVAAVAVVAVVCLVIVIVRLDDAAPDLDDTPAPPATATVPPVGPNRSADGPARSAPDVTETAPEAPRPEPVPPAKTAVAPPGSAGNATGSVHVRVAYVDDGEPARAIEVELEHVRDGVAARRSLTTRTDREGWARFDSVAAGPAVVTAASLDERLLVQVEAGVTIEELLDVSRGIDVAGVVVESRSGTPVEGAQVFLASRPGSLRDGEVVAVTGADGRFELVHAAAGRHVGVRAPGFLPSRVQALADARRGRASLRFLLRRGGGAVSGLVLAADGSRLPATVRVTEQPPPGRRSAAATFMPFDVVCDEEGRFLVEGIAPGPVLVEVVAAGYAPQSRELRVAEGTTPELVFDLTSGCTLTGTVSGSDDEPLARVFVATGRPGRLSFRTTRTGADGAFAIEHLTPGPLTVLVDAGELGRAEKDMVGSDGGLLRWDVVLRSRDSIAGYVVFEDGGAAGNVRVAAVAAARSEEGAYWGGAAWTDSTGGFAIAGLRAVPHRIQVQLGPATRASFDPLPIEGLPHGVVPGGRELVIEIPHAALPSSTITGVVTVDDPDREGVRVLVRRAGDANPTPNYTVARDGSFTTSLLQPGRYRVEIVSERHGRYVLPECEVGVEEDHDLGTLELDDPGVLIAEVDAGSTTAPLRFTVTNDSGRPVWMSESRARLVRSGPLRPGSYALNVTDGQTAFNVEFVIKSNGNTRLSVTMP